MPFPTGTTAFESEISLLVHIAMKTLTILRSDKCNKKKVVEICLLNQTGQTVLPQKNNR